MDYGNTKTPSMHCRLGSMTVAAGFLQGRQPKFPMGEIPFGQYSCKKLKKERKKVRTEFLLSQKSLNLYRAWASGSWQSVLKALKPAQVKFCWTTGWRDQDRSSKYRFFSMPQLFIYIFFVTSFVSHTELHWRTVQSIVSTYLCLFGVWPQAAKKCDTICAC